MSKHHWAARSRAAIIHLALSALVACAAALLVFGLWYPYPYSHVSGGLQLFGLMMAIDVVVGPLLTMLVYNLNKPRTELRRDIAIIVALQLAALAYGLFSVWQARPVQLVLEYDRFRVVHAADIPETLWNDRPEGTARLPWNGPGLQGLRPVLPEERERVLMDELNGVTPAARPEFWMDYTSAWPASLRYVRPVSALQARHPELAEPLQTWASQNQRGLENLGYLALEGRRKVFWSVVVDVRDGAIVGYLPVDGTQ
jgi:hypothetical protein